MINLKLTKEECQALTELIDMAVGVGRLKVAGISHHLALKIEQAVQESQEPKEKKTPKKQKVEE